MQNSAEKNGKTEPLVDALAVLATMKLAYSQQDVADLMEMKRSSVSKAFNGYDGYYTQGFVSRFNTAFGGIFNEEYLLGGVGVLLIDETSKLPLTDVGLRLEAVINAYEGEPERGKVKRFAEAMGVKPVEVVHWLIDETVPTEVLIHVTEVYEDVSYEWLTTGNGRMRLSEVVSLSLTPSEGALPIYDVDFACGFVEFFPDEERIIGYHKLEPFTDAERFCIVRATGHSMSPTICDRDFVIIGRKPLLAEDIIFSEVYGVVTTEDMRTIKRVVRSEQKGHLRLYADNPDPRFGDYQDIPLSKIRQLFRVYVALKITIL